MNKRRSRSAAGRSHVGDPAIPHKSPSSRLPAVKSLSMALKNERCAYCGINMPGEGENRPTKEHVVPTSITGSRAYDFMACLACGNQKSRLDELIAWMVKFGEINVNVLGRFDPKSVSPEGRKSLMAIIRQFDIVNPSSCTYLGEEWAMLSGDWSIIDGMSEWTRWFARGIYFLETGQVLKRKEAMHYPGRMILTELLLAGEIVQAAKWGLDKGPARRIFRPAAGAPTWGDVWLEWPSIKYPKLACLCLGGKYALCATVAPYSKKKLLASANRLIQYHRVPGVRDGVIVDLRKVRGKMRWILNVGRPTI